MGRSLVESTTQLCEILIKLIIDKEGHTPGQMHPQERQKNITDFKKLLTTAAVKADINYPLKKISIKGQIAQQIVASTRFETVMGLCARLDDIELTKFVLTHCVSDEMCAPYNPMLYWIGKRNKYITSQQDQQTVQVYDTLITLCIDYYVARKTNVFQHSGVWKDSVLLALIATECSKTNDHKFSMDLLKKLHDNHVPINQDFLEYVNGIIPGIQSVIGPYFNKSTSKPVVLPTRANVKEHFREGKNRKIISPITLLTKQNGQNASEAIASYIATASMLPHFISDLYANKKMVYDKQLYLQADFFNVHADNFQNLNESLKISFFNEDMESPKVWEQLNKKTEYNFKGMARFIHDLIPVVQRHITALLYHTDAKIFAENGKNILANIQDTAWMIHNFAIQAIPLNKTTAENTENKALIESATLEAKIITVLCKALQYKNAIFMNDQPLVHYYKMKLIHLSHDLLPQIKDCKHTTLRHLFLEFCVNPLAEHYAAQGMWKSLRAVFAMINTSLIDIKSNDPFIGEALVQAMIKMLHHQHAFGQLEATFHFILSLAEYKKYFLRLTQATTKALAQAMIDNQALIDEHKVCLMSVLLSYAENGSIHIDDALLTMRIPLQAKLDINKYIPHAFQVKLENNVLIISDLLSITPVSLSAWLIDWEKRSLNLPEPQNEVVPEVVVALPPKTNNTLLAYDNAIRNNIPKDKHPMGSRPIQAKKNEEVEEQQSVTDVSKILTAVRAHIPEGYDHLTMIQWSNGAVPDFTHYYVIDKGAACQFPDFINALEKGNEPKQGVYYNKSIPPFGVDQLGVKLYKDGSLRLIEFGDTRLNGSLHAEFNVEDRSIKLYRIDGYSNHNTLKRDEKPKKFGF